MKGDKEFEEILNTINEAQQQYQSMLPQLERESANRIELLLKDLDTKNGNVVASVKNLRKLQEIDREFRAALESEKAVKAYENYAKSYGKVTDLEAQYFNSMFEYSGSQAIINEIQKQSLEDLDQAIWGPGLDTNVIDPTVRLVRQGIESGQPWSELREAVRNYLTTQEIDGELKPGAFSRYATTITNDSLETYARSQEQVYSQAVGGQWFKYVGANKDTTREFCNVLRAKKWVHESEIPGFIHGKIGNKSVPLYRRTGKPHGMKSQTTASNFQQLCGGWNCNHHLMPVADELVPEGVKSSILKGEEPKPEIVKGKDLKSKTIDEAREAAKYSEAKIEELKKRFAAKFDNEYAYSIEEARQGFNAPVETISLDEIKQDVLDGNENIILQRGWGSRTQPKLNSFIEGNQDFVPKGAYGNGYYFTGNRGNNSMQLYYDSLLANGYSFDQKVTVARLKPGAKIIDFSEAEKMYANDFATSSKMQMDMLHNKAIRFEEGIKISNELTRQNFDIGAAMTARGYDAIKAEVGNDQYYYVILNRTAIQFVPEAQEFEKWSNWLAEN